MNKKNILQIFSSYLQLPKTEEKAYDPCMAWEQAAAFQERFDLEADDFAAMLKNVYEHSKDMFDDILHPFEGLVYMAEEDHEAEAVRELFRGLYKEDGGDLSMRQMKIKQFIRGANQLLEEHHPGSSYYRNDQHSAMAYLWLHDPKDNYQFKMSEVEYFAYAVEFHDIFNKFDTFDLSTYYHFCDEMVKELQANAELMAEHQTRFNGEKKWEEGEYMHILLYDLIHCADVYQLYNGMVIKKHSIDERKKYRANKEKAKELGMQLAEIEKKVILYQEGMEKIRKLVCEDEPVVHKSYGPGKIIEVDDRYIKVHFDKQDLVKKFQLMSAIGGGFLKLKIDGFEEFYKFYGDALKNETLNLHRMNGMKEIIEPYAQYL